MSDETTAFEVLTEDGLRWTVEINGNPADAERTLDGYIERGVIQDAGVNGFGDKGWRVNCGKITAYRLAP